MRKRPGGPHQCVCKSGCPDQSICHQLSNCDAWLLRKEMAR